MKDVTFSTNFITFFLYAERIFVIEIVQISRIFKNENVVTSDIRAFGFILFNKLRVLYNFQTQII